jgi:hypothetical protein
MADRTLPDPYGCEDCGIDRLGHGIQYTKTVGMHRWIKPSNEQILQRMRARYIVRNGGEQ